MCARSHGRSTWRRDRRKKREQGERDAYIILIPNCVIILLITVPRAPKLSHRSNSDRKRDICVSSKDPSLRDFKDGEFEFYDGVFNYSFIRLFENETLFWDGKRFETKSLRDAWNKIKGLFAVPAAHGKKCEKLRNNWQFVRVTCYHVWHVEQRRHGTWGLSVWNLREVEKRVVEIIDANWVNWRRQTEGCYFSLAAAYLLIPLYQTCCAIRSPIYFGEKKKFSWLE